MLLMFEEGTRGVISQAIYECAKANNEYMNNYDKNIITMSQKCPVDGFKWVKSLSQFNEDFIKNYHENSNMGYSLEVDVEYPKKIFNLHKDLPSLSERKKNWKGKKTCLQYRRQKGIFVHIKLNYGLKLNHSLKLKKVHRVIQFNQKAWLKPYIDMNTKLRKEAKN